jgi:hypothetical protein
MKVEGCVEEIAHPRIALKDKGSESVILLNPTREEVHRLKIDDCAIAEGIRADWALYRADEYVLIVELKATDFKHGADQCLRTAEKFLEHFGSNFRVAALLVGRQSPKIQAAMQVKKREFARRFKGPLNKVTGGAELPLRRAFEFLA